MCLVAQSCLTLCDPMDCCPPGSSVYRDSPAKNTGVGFHALLQGIFPTQVSHIEGDGLFGIWDTRGVNKGKVGGGKWPKWENNTCKAKETKKRRNCWKTKGQFSGMWKTGRKGFFLKLKWDLGVRSLSNPQVMSKIQFSLLRKLGSQWRLALCFENVCSSAL